MSGTVGRGGACRGALAIGGALAPVEIVQLLSRVFVWVWIDAMQSPERDQVGHQHDHADLSMGSRTPPAMESAKIPVSFHIAEGAFNDCATLPVESLCLRSLHFCTMGFNQLFIVESLDRPARLGLWAALCLQGTHLTVFRGTAVSIAIYVFLAAPPGDFLQTFALADCSRPPP